MNIILLILSLFHPEKYFRKINNNITIPKATRESVTDETICNTMYTII